MISSLEWKILQNKLKLSELRDLPIHFTAFLETSIKDCLEYYKTYCKVELNSILYDGEFMVLLSKTNNKNFSLSCKKIQVILKYFNISFPMKDLENIYFARNQIAHSVYMKDEIVDNLFIFKIVDDLTQTIVKLL